MTGVQTCALPISRQFVYHAGKVTDTHKDNAKVKSSATTQLVSQIILSDGRTLSYEYDAEERITKVTDSVDGTTTYTYDALGQLLEEKVNGKVVNSMEYDNNGNITKKNGKEYAYVTQSGRICSPDLTEKQFRTMRRATRPLISAKR